MVECIELFSVFIIEHCLPLVQELSDKTNKAKSLLSSNPTEVNRSLQWGYSHTFFHILIFTCLSQSNCIM